jgi:glycerophosphoryl diester phosphodiesterase
VVNVEVKSNPLEAGFDPAETAATEVVALLAGTGARSPARVIVSSFWPASLAAVRMADPTVATGLLVHPSLDPREMLAQAEGLGCAALHPFHTAVDVSLVDLVHQRGMGVVTWTVNGPADVAAVVRAGADAVISDSVAETLRTVRAA